MAGVRHGVDAARPAARRGASTARSSPCTPDHSVLASGPAPAEEAYTVAAALPGARITALRLEALPDPSLPQGGPGRDYYGNFALTGLDGHALPQPAAPIAFVSAADDDHVGGNEAAQLLKAPEKTGRSRDLPPGWSIDATRDDLRLRRQAVLTLASPLAGGGRTRAHDHALVRGRQRRTGTRPLPPVGDRRARTRRVRSSSGRRFAASSKPRRSSAPPPIARPCAARSGRRPPRSPRPARPSASSRTRSPASASSARR